MPRFWSAEIELGEEEKFLVNAKPNASDFRSTAFSWIPYRAGDKFIATIDISDISAGNTFNQDKPVRIICRLREPDGKFYILVDENLSLPYSKPTPVRYLALKGEYVLDITLVSSDGTVAIDSHAEVEDCDVEEIQGNRRLTTLEAVPQGTLIRGNRRLITLEAVSQDFWVTNATLGLVAIGLGAVGSLLIKLLV